MNEIVDLHDAADAAGKLADAIASRLTEEYREPPRYALEHVRIAIAQLRMAQASFKLAWMEQLENR